MSELEKWSALGRELVRLLVASGVGTIVLMSLADNPWDGDELVKGPAAGLSAYGGDRGLRKLFKSDNGG